MSYIDQLYMPTQERRKRVLACKRIFCECSRCLDPIQPERTVLCPHCRPTKLCFLSENTEEQVISHRGGEATLEGRDAGLLQADGTDAADHRECIADESHSDTNQTPDTQKTSKTAQPEQVKEKECAAISSETRVVSNCLNSAYEEDYKDSTDTYSDASPSSACSEPDREDGRIGALDKFCIVGTAIATKRADTDVKGGTENEERRSADTDILEGGELQKEHMTCEMEEEGSSASSDASSSVACCSRKSFTEQTQTVYSDDKKDSDGNSELLCMSLVHASTSAHSNGNLSGNCNSSESDGISEQLRTSFVDASTSAHSYGNCNSGDFSDGEQEQSVKGGVRATPAEGEQRVPFTEDQQCTSGALTREGNLTKRNPGTHCVFEGAGRWSCGACGRQFTDNDMPVALETYLTGYYAALRARLGRPTPEAWNAECGQLIRTVEKVLGVEHWLYVAGHLMLAQLYLGMWLGGHVVDVILTQALRHAALVVSFASRPAFSAAKCVDVAPLVTAVLRVLLFNGRCHDFVEWVEKRGALQVIRETIGTYDEVYISFSTAYLYVRQKIDGGSDPSLSLLHRFAHASQYTIALAAAYYEKKEAERKEEAARLKESEAEEAEVLAREHTLRDRQIQDIQKNIAALKASSPSEKPNKVQDVTFTNPESVVGQYLRKYAAPGATVGNTIAALCEGLGGLPGEEAALRPTLCNAELTAKAAYEQAKRLQQLAIEGRYPAGLPPAGGPPENGYLPLIMLADPLETGARQLRNVHKTCEVMEREKKRCEELKQMMRNCSRDSRSVVEDANTSMACTEREDTSVASNTRTHTSTTNEKSFVYRIPGLPGTAPGEFVTISHINHTKDGSYPPIPFFRTFFYVDHEARNMSRRTGENEQPSVNIKVLGCGVEGVTPLTKDELDDLEAARYNFLHVEAERFNKETRTALVFEMGRRAQEAVAALDSIKSVEARKPVLSEGANSVSPVDILHEVNKAAKDVATQDARTVQCVEDFRKSKSVENAEDPWTVATVHRPKKRHVDDRLDVCAPQTLDPRLSPEVKERSFTKAAPAPATLHSAAEPHLTGPEAPELRLRWEIKRLPHFPVEVQSQEKTLGTGKATGQGRVAQNEMLKDDLLAARIAVDYLHNNTEGDFFKVVKTLYLYRDQLGRDCALTTDYVYRFVEENQAELNRALDYSRDFEYDYFGYKTLERCCVFRRIFNDAARYVDQGGGKRRGSMAVYLEPWHFDIFDFLDMRKSHGKEERRARDLFGALWIPDLFMERVEDNAGWTLMCPNECPGLTEVWGDDFKTLYEKYEGEGRGRKTIPAQYLWFAILQAQIETGTPYMMYKDACNKKSNQKNLGTIKCGNLCTEVVEFTSKDEVAVCNLASVSLPRFVDPQSKSFDYEKLKAVVKVITRNLNRVIDRNHYPLPEARRSNMRHRPIGIGVQGLADAFMIMRYPFDSVEARVINKNIFECIYFAALEASCELAAIEGPYETYRGSPASEGILQFDMWGVKPESGLCDWDGLKKKINVHGLRNSLLVSPMPTASTSQILGNNEAFEPFISNIYYRRVLSGEFPVVNAHLVRDLAERGLWTEETRQLLIAHNGSVQHLDAVPDDLKALYKTAWEIKQRTLLDLAVDRSPFVDQSQSLNIHMVNPTYAKLTSMHFYGWKRGLKTGLYYLRTRPAADAVKVTVDSGIASRAQAKQNAARTDVAGRNSSQVFCEAARLPIRSPSDHAGGMPSDCAEQPIAGAGTIHRDDDDGTSATARPQHSGASLGAEFISDHSLSPRLPTHSQSECESSRPHSLHLSTPSSSNDGCFTCSG
ncbi:UNVERIFIED_CONTAM: hypothetical protein H355_006113 [Colinus virginianus]|nr:hypothetical protein H355_006113 [Colinus virginianus]